MFFGEETERERIRREIIEKAADDEVTVLPPKSFGEIRIIGKNHKEAARYYEEKIKECSRMGDEIRLHCEIEEKFSVALLNIQE